MADLLNYGHEASTELSFVGDGAWEYNMSEKTQKTYLKTSLFVAKFNFMRILFVALMLFSFSYFTYSQTSDGLKLNQIQIIGSHNSYKKLPDPRVMKFLMKFKKQLGKSQDPKGIDYGHLPIDSQFSDYHVRGLEIDIHNDPKGGAFYKRKINLLVRGMHQNSHIEALRKPGFKVLHIKDVDYQTYYYTFIDALTALRQWSDAHPKHLPLFINIETKTGGPGDASGFLRFIGFKREIPYDAAACDSIDAELRAVFGNELHNILTPDRLRGRYSSLEEMVKQNGWPQLDDCRGKIIFIMLGDAKSTYAHGHPSLSGRAMCTYSSPGQPECAFIMQDDAVSDSSTIVQLVKDGYIVRTRSDAETTASRENDSRAKNAAFASGAQITSTDYYKPDLRFSTFEVQWDGKHAGRINPISCPAKTGWLTEP